MEQILYSHLTAGTDTHFDKWESLLEQGIKIICFLDKKGIEKLSNWKYAYHPYFRYYSNNDNIKVIINDGKITSETAKTLSKLAASDSRFNIEQYCIEHSEKEDNLCVEAGAGTGKTTVMIDRIMFLYHTDPDFSFNKVAMITFTNKATDNMRHRLLAELDRRYRLTHNIKYLQGLEEIAQLTINTIHSFFRKIIIEVGPLMGYGTNMQLRSYTYEKKEILKDLLNNAYGNSSATVKNQLGLTMYEIQQLAYEYWNKMENNGLSDDEIKNLNWGENTDSRAQKIQNQLIHIFSQVDSIYNEQKLKNNAISMKDIIHELGRVVHLEEAKPYITSSYDYIFCDEFQDSDIVQIKTLSLLAQIYECKLFVVGDIKQSIYRFRGATDAAFHNLIERASDIQFKSAALVKNYRTSINIMEELHPIFTRWNQNKYLQYENKDRLEPQNRKYGIYKKIPVTSKNRKSYVMNTIKEILKHDENAIITILTRTNNELQQVRLWCEEDPDIIHQIKDNESFFTSPAVLDVCALLEGMLYDGIPMYVWEFCNTPYVNVVNEINLEKLKSFNGEPYKILKELYSCIDKDTWDKYQEDIKNRPVLSVLRDIINTSSPVEHYALKRMDTLKRKGINNDNIITQVLLDTRLYKANLDKLLQLLQDRFSSDFCSLYDICNYLRICIETGRKEEQASISRFSDKGYVEGYTVHSAKGLEFEHVLIPFMTFPFISDSKSEILLSNDNASVGWVYRKKEKDGNIDEIASTNYQLMKMHEAEELIRDESRLLYVAMTRTISSLYCFPTVWPPKDGVNNWSNLL